MYPYVDVFIILSIFYVYVFILNVPPEYVLDYAVFRHGCSILYTCLEHVIHILCMQRFSCYIQGNPWLKGFVASSEKHTGLSRSSAMFVTSDLDVTCLDSHRAAPEDSRVPGRLISPFLTSWFVKLSRQG